MKPNISEFSYGYAITDELVNWVGTPLKAAPVFPSLIKEGQTGGGYDLYLDRPGLPLFLQFKLSDFMKGGNTPERKLGCFSSPFYRMHLRALRNSAQHELLLDLEQKGNEVLYSAPAFHDIKDFDDAFLCKQVIARSVFIPPTSIGVLPDDKEHHVSFQLPGEAYFCSEPIRIAYIAGDGLSKHLQLHMAHAQREHVTLDKAIQRADADLTSAIETVAKARIRRREQVRTQKSRPRRLDDRQLVGPDRGSRTPHTESVDEAVLIMLDSPIFRTLGPIQRVAYLSRVVLGAEFLVVREKEEQR